MIGVLSAMEFESKIILDALKNVETIEKGELKFYRGFYKGKELVLSVMGVGKVQSALCTQKMLNCFEGISAVLHIGVAGALADKMQIGDIVLAEKLYYHDFDKKIMEEHMPFCTYFEADKKLLSLASSLLVIEGAKYYTGVMVTGDSFIDSDSKVQKILDDIPQALCVDMESCALAHSCYLEKIPFFVARSISDFSNENIDVTYQKNKHRAAVTSANLVLNMIEEM